MFLKKFWGFLYKNENQPQFLIINEITAKKTEYQIFKSVCDSIASQSKSTG